MRHPHLSSGGRYPVLRALAILYMVSGFGLLGYGIYMGVKTMTSAPDDVGGRALVAVYWIAGSFLAAIVAFAVGELIKLFMDIEYNTRRTAHHSMPAGATDAERDAAENGPGVPLVGNGRGKWLEGDETAEGALIRGH